MSAPLVEFVWRIPPLDAVEAEPPTIVLPPGRWRYVGGPLGCAVFVREGSPRPPRSLGLHAWQLSGGAS